MNITAHRMGETTPMMARRAPQPEAGANLPPLRAPKLLDQLRERIRYLHYSRRTEQAYVHWCRAFIRFHGLRHPAEMGAAEVEAFLQWLAAERNAAPSTHNQALSALLFLYTKVLELDLPLAVEHRAANRPAAFARGADARRGGSGAAGFGWRAPAPGSPTVRHRPAASGGVAAAGQRPGLCSPGAHGARRQRRQGPGGDAARLPSTRAENPVGERACRLGGGCGRRPKQGRTAPMRWSASIRARGMRGRGSGSFLRDSTRRTRAAA